MDGVYTAIIKMEEVRAIQIEFIVIQSTSLCRKAYDSSCELCNIYNTMYTDIYDLITDTQNQEKSIYDAVKLLERA